MEDSPSATEFRECCQRLVGELCWGHVAGAGTGSHVALEFGRQTPRARPTRNPHLTEAMRQFKGELSLFLCCTWRLDAPERVVCGGWDDNSASGPMLAGLDQLLGARVRAVELRQPAWDLDVTFDNGMTLHVFCDLVGPDEVDNYTVTWKGRIYGVGPRGRLELELPKSTPG